MRLAVLAILLNFAAIAQVLHQDGEYWVQVTRGSFDLAPSSSLRVLTRGPVNVQGGNEPGARYELRARVRTSSRAEAERFLSGVSLQQRTTAALTRLSLNDPQNVALTELTLHTPRRFRAAAIETRAGNVMVTDLDTPVDVQSAGGNLVLERIGAGVDARTGGGEVRMGRIAGSVRTYTGGGSIYVERSGGESWLETAGGEIHVRESAGATHASTAGGNILVERSGGAVWARTAGGRIEVHEANGYVHAGNQGGSIQVGSARNVHCEASSGMIRLRGASGELRAIADAGNIRAELLAGVPLRDSILSSRSGDITVLIPSNLALTVQAQSESGQPGRIVSEFPEIAVRRAGALGANSYSASGALNGGGPVLKLTVAGGTIFLKRQR